MKTTSRPSSPRRPVAALLAAGATLAFTLGATLVTLVTLAAPASAHAALVRITPALNAQLTAAPTQVEVEFNEPVSTKFATIVVTSAAGTNVARGTTTVLGGKVTQPLGTGLTSGAYRVAYRVTSDDGHPVTGESTFTLTLASGPSNAPATPSAPATATPSQEGDRATPEIPLVVQEEGWLKQYVVPISGAAGLLVIGGGVLLWERRRR